MMRRTADLAYLRADGYQAVLLPYQASRLAMAIVLPDGPLPTLAPRLAGGLGPLLAGAARQSVALSLPKFRQRAGFGLIPVLRQLGIEDALTDAADFSGITAQERLSISAVVHQAYIDVDEQGTEAAAATAIGMRPMAMRQRTRPDPDGRGPALPVRHHRHGDRPAAVPRPGHAARRLNRSDHVYRLSAGKDGLAAVTDQQGRLHVMAQTARGQRPVRPWTARNHPPSTGSSPCWPRSAVSCSAMTPRTSARR